MDAAVFAAAPFSDEGDVKVVEGDGDVTLVRKCFLL